MSRKNPRPLRWRIRRAHLQCRAVASSDPPFVAFRSLVEVLCDILDVGISGLLNVFKRLGLGFDGFVVLHGLEEDSSVARRLVSRSISFSSFTSGLRLMA